MDRKDQEQTRVRQLAYENKQLQREVAKLRRQLEKSNAMMGIVPEREPEEAILDTPKKVKVRACHKCGVGFLGLIKYDRAGEPYYFRQCNNCDHRTRGQKYHDGVEE